MQRPQRAARGRTTLMAGRARRRLGWPGRAVSPSSDADRAPACQAGRVTAARQPDRATVLDRVRAVLGRLVRDGTAEARSDGTVHRLFPVAVGPAEGAAIRSWVVREAAACTIEVGLGYGIRRCSSARGCSPAAPRMPPRGHRPQPGHPLRRLRPAAPGRGRSSRHGGTSRRGITDHPAPDGERRPPVRPRRHRRQPPVRRVLR
jgi:hypothetical protein